MKSEAVQRSIMYDSQIKDELEITTRLLNMVLDMPVSQQVTLLKQLDQTGLKGTRKQKRTTLKAPWFVSIDPQKATDRYEHSLKDISSCGMFIETKRSFTVGQHIRITFQTPVSRKLIQMVGEVVRFEESGIGVKFKRRV